MNKQPENRDALDDGRTVANMNVAGMPWYRSKKELSAQKQINDLGMTKKEKWAVIVGAYKAYIPIFAGILAGFTVGYLLFLLFAYLT